MPGVQTAPKKSRSIEARLDPLMRSKRRAGAWRKLATERPNPGSRRLDQLGIARTVALMQREDRRVLAALARARPAIVRAAKIFRACFLAGRTSYLFGAGTSGRLAVLEAAELPPTFGTDPRRVRAVIAGGRTAVFRAREGAEDRADEGARLARPLPAGDLVIGVSASSVTPFVRGALQSRPRARGARTVLVTASRSPGLSRAAEIVVRLDVGPEVIAGSTRLKAGTRDQARAEPDHDLGFRRIGKGLRPLDGRPARRLRQAQRPRRRNRGRRLRRAAGEGAGAPLPSAPARSRRRS